MKSYPAELKTPNFAVDAFGAAGSDFLTVFFDADFLAAIV
jgi:hypothetical protein